MKLYLKSTKSILTLALTLTASTAFSMDIAEKTAFFQPVESGTMHPSIPRNPLFSAEEWMDIEIGRAILQDRIRQKQDILSVLADEAVSLGEKIVYCQNDFGIILYAREESDFEESIQQGIKRYGEYISSLLNTYRSAEQLIQLSINANTQENKNQHQNNLYYFLSVEKKIFREFITQNYTHQIPEHSLEDTFYEMIASKVCAKATKEFDVLSEYIKISRVSGGAEKQIDNRKLRDHYESTHKELITNFNKSHPIFWLSSINDTIKKIADPQVEAIKLKLHECSSETTNITTALCAQIESYKEPAPDDATNIIALYNTFGPLILDTIQGYEAISTKIKEIEKNATLWLEKFKENKKLFRSIPQKTKQNINNYFQEQKRIELSRTQEAERAAQPQRVPKRKQRTNTKQPSAKSIRTASELLPKNSTSTKEELTQQDIVTLTEKTASKAQVDPMVAAPTPVVTEATAPRNAPAPAASPILAQPKKLKVKTRPDPLNIPVLTIEKTEEKALPLTLPDQFKTPGFNSFVKSLLAEKNDKKLIKLFKELNTVYGIFSETNEKNNKGYFSVRSPITNELYVRTYHHLHVAQPYASIFMAVWDVLIDAHLIER